MTKKTILLLFSLLLPLALNAQFSGTERPAGDSTLVISLDDALKIALSENVSVKVADQEVRRAEYAKKGSYSALFPQINASGMYSYAIQKQKVYFGSDDTSSGSGNSGGGMASMMQSAFEPIMYYIQQLYTATQTPFVPYVAPAQPETESSGSDAIEMGRRNQVSLGITAAMPVVNFQLWESLRISGEQVDLAVEKARESRLGMVTSVKQAYFAVLMAKASYDVYNAVYENAVENYKLTEMRYNAQKASELDFTRAKSSLASAIPNLFNAENAVSLALWQLKAVMGMDLDKAIDVSGALEDYAAHMFYELNEGEHASLENNTQLRQLAAQAEMLARQIRMQQYAYIPTLSMQLSYNYYTQSDLFNLSQWKWMPSSTLVFSLSIPIFSGGQRYFAIKQTRLQADELELQRENAERQIRIGIRQSLSTMDTAMKTYDAARDALESAEKAYDIAERSYQVGKSTLTDLNNTELVLTQTRLQTAQAVYNFVVAKAALEQTLGYDFADQE
ncbi:MAG: TolC family protein [Bacteroidales bacterium]|nr:TolC family protein [Bacteroidales bacterium]MBP5373484.1 TolC family protein [Bacteroidales bacterium]